GRPARDSVRTRALPRLTPAEEIFRRATYRAYQTIFSGTFPRSSRNNRIRNSPRVRSEGRRRIKTTPTTMEMDSNKSDGRGQTADRKFKTRTRKSERGMTLFAIMAIMAVFVV